MESMILTTIYISRPESKMPEKINHIKRILLHLIVVGISLFQILNGIVSGAEGSSLYFSGTPTYTAPRNYGFLGYSKPRSTKPVPPSGKEREIPETSSIAVYDSVPPAGKSGVNELWSLDNDPPLGAESRLSHFMLEPRPIRSSILQGAAVDFSYLANSKNVQSGMYQIEGSATFGFPCPSLNTPLLISPICQWTEWNVPNQLQNDLGNKLSLISAGLSMEYLGPVHDSLLLDLNLDLLWASDTHARTSEALRIIGYGSAIWRLGDRSRMVLGVSYNDVGHFKIVPIAGLLFKPTDDLVLELLFPRPKISWKLPDHCHSNSRSNAPYWIYLAGEYETGKWNIRAKNGSLFSDKTTYSYHDVRLFGGIERKSLSELNWALEGGIAFDRHLQVDNSDFHLHSEIKPGTTGFARLKIMY